MPKIGKLIEIEIRLEIAKTWKEEGVGSDY